MPTARKDLEARKAAFETARRELNAERAQTKASTTDLDAGKGDAKVALEASEEGSASSQQAESDDDAVLRTYADIAHAMYEDSLIAAKALKAAIDDLDAKSSDAGLAAAKDAWRAARVGAHAECPKLQGRADTSAIESLKRRVSGAKPTCPDSHGEAWSDPF